MPPRRAPSPAGSDESNSTEQWVNDISSSLSTLSLLSQPRSENPLAKSKGTKKSRAPRSDSSSASSLSYAASSLEITLNYFGQNHSYSRLVVLRAIIGEFRTCSLVPLVLLVWSMFVDTKQSCERRRTFLIRSPSARKSSKPSCTSISRNTSRAGTQCNGVPSKEYVLVSPPVELLDFELISG